MDSVFGVWVEGALGVLGGNEDDFAPKYMETNSLGEFLAKHSKEHEPRKVFAYTHAAMINLVKERLQLLGVLAKLD